MATVTTKVSAADRPPWLDAAIVQSVALLVAAGVALLAGSLIAVGYGANPLDVYGAIIEYAFRDATSFGAVLATATPLIFSALALAVCFKGGLFNIGVEGQFLFAMVTATWAALSLDFMPGGLHLLAVLLAAMVGGMVFASVPAVLKVKTGAHEVVTTIMMNGIAVSMVAWALNGPLKLTSLPTGTNADLRSDIFEDSALVPRLGAGLGIEDSAQLSWLFPIAIVAAVAVWFLIKRMRLGYEARAVGASPGSAKAGGIEIGSVQIKLFLISGALAGLVGMQQLLVERGSLVQNYQALLGFTGIAVAFLARNNPIGIIFAAFVWAVLSRGDTAVQLQAGLPREFVIILQGILILSVVIVYEIAARRLTYRQLQREVDATDAEAPSDLAATGGTA
ncbi:MAG: ABC transporter permease [Actinomycetota bacterium]